MKKEPIRILFIAYFPPEKVYYGQGYKIINEIIEELTILCGATNISHTIMDSVEIGGYITVDKKKCLTRYLKNTSCSSAKIEDPNNFWYKQDIYGKMKLRPRIIITCLALAVLVTKIVTMI